MGRALDAGAGLVLILDYDGTLTPIAASPGAAVLAPSIRRALRRLAAAPRVRLAILSGRSLRDVRARVGIDHVVYGGCHGFEIAGAGLAFRHPAARRAALRDVRRAVASALDGIPGAFVEDKGVTVGVHYRRVPRARHPEVLEAVARVRRGAPRLRVLSGKRVAEFLPRVRWGKGHAARWIAGRAAGALGTRQAVVLYAGDDSTDEAAFSVLRPRGVTVRVGSGESAAEYAVAGVREVHALLRWLVRATEGRR